MQVNQNIASTSAARQYIGQYSDTSGLDYLNARYYNSSQGQFISQDPIFLSSPKQQDLQNPQSLNPYSYADDNPITREDPTGDITQTQIAALQNFYSAFGESSAAANVVSAFGGSIGGGGKVTSSAGSPQTTSNNSITMNFSTPEVFDSNNLYSNNSNNLYYATIPFIPVVANSTPAFSPNTSIPTPSLPLQFNDKINDQINERGWGNQDTVTDTVENYYHASPATDRTVTPNEPATAYYNENGAYTSVNNSSGNVVQVSDYKNPGSWTPDSSIQDPYILPGDIVGLDIIIY